jgi:hypothetical protein
VVGLGLLIGCLLISLVASGGWGTRGREERLRSNLAELRAALAGYEKDHGFFPCTASDHNADGDPDVFTRQLTEYTDRHGEPSPERTERYHFGPYMPVFPREAISGTRIVIINQQTERPRSSLARAVQEGTGHGGWYYEARSGNIVPNLGADFPKPYATY